MVLCVLFGGLSFHEGIDCLSHCPGTRRSPVRMAMNTTASLQDDVDAETRKFMSNVTGMQPSARYRESRLHAMAVAGQHIDTLFDFRCSVTHLATHCTGMELIGTQHPDDMRQRTHRDSMLRVPGECGMHGAVDMNWHLNP